MKKLATAIVLAGLTATQASAAKLEFLTANLARKYCSNTVKIDAETQTMMSTACSTTMIDAYMVAVGFMEKTICAPSNMSTEQLANTVGSYQLRHASEIGDTDLLFFVALDALKETWPCQK